MERRDVLKALAALPLTFALRNSEGESERRHHFGAVEVYLEGALALVVQEDKGNSILAFSPRPAKNSEQHEFYLDNTKLPESGKEIKFRLSLEKARHVIRPEINPGLKDFLFKTENWHVGDSIATIEFPAPDRITFSGRRTRVEFQNDGRIAFMSANHILEYDLREPIKPALECSEAKVKCEPSEDKYDNVTRYFFEVGPKHSLNHEEARAHAAAFFNFILEQSFPDLAKRDLLRVPDEQRKSSMLMPAVFQGEAPRSLRKDASFLVECEYSGPVVVTKSPARP